MLDTLMIPLLALVVVAYVAVVWILWFRRKDGRALKIGDDEQSPSPRRYSNRRRN